MEGLYRLTKVCEQDAVRAARTLKVECNVSTAVCVLNEPGCTHPCYCATKPTEIMAGEHISKYLLKESQVEASHTQAELHVTIRRLCEGTVCLIRI